MIYNKIGDRMIESMTKILNKAKEEKYAVPAYNVNNLEWARFILEASEETRSPAILEVSEGAIKYMGGYQTVSDMIRALVKDLNITVPVAIHLDHGSSFESCKKAIDAGFTSVMIDASKYPILENINLTKEVVNYAHKYGVSVEAEVGHIGGEKTEIAYASPEECVKLVKETNIDFLAPALGSVHGLYKGTPHLELELAKEISTLTNLPLVLHGGTGIPENMLLDGIKCGICKININTELQIVWSKAVRVYLKENADVYDPRKIIKAGEKAIKEAIIYKNKTLGSINKY